MGIFVDSDLHAPSGVQDVELVINEDMPIMAPVGAAPAFGFGVEDVKFKRYLAGVDSQELFREVAGGFVCHTVFFFAKEHLETAKSRQEYMVRISRFSHLIEEADIKVSRPLFFVWGV